MEISKLILASTSPRRRDLMTQAGYDFEIVAGNVCEQAPKGTSAVSVAKHNALEKALAGAACSPADALVIGADTVVCLDGRILGKPADEDEASTFLHELSGRTHQVVTGVALVYEEAFFQFHESTDVTFKALDDETIAAYVASGDPLDKAGAYGIQSSGNKLVASIEGDYDNVVGLPMARLTRMLEKLGIRP